MEKSVEELEALMDAARNDSNRVRGGEEWSRIQKQWVDALVRAQKPLLQDLAQAGWPCSTVWDLVNERSAYPELLPILMRHFDMPYHKRTRDGIIRSLTVPYGGNELAEFLVDRYKKESDDSIRIMIGNAISVSAQEAQLEQIRRFVDQEKYGESRIFLLSALARLDGKAAIPVLRRFLKPGQVLRAQAIIELGKLKAEEAEAEIAPFVKDPDPYVREKARAAIKKISKATAAGKLKN